MKGGRLSAQGQQTFFTDFILDSKCIVCKKRGGSGSGSAYRLAQLVCPPNCSKVEMSNGINCNLLGLKKRKHSTLDKCIVNEVLKAL